MQNFQQNQEGSKIFHMRTENAIDTTIVNGIRLWILCDILILFWRNEDLFIYYIPEYTTNYHTLLKWKSKMKRYCCHSGSNPLFWCSTLVLIQSPPVSKTIPLPTQAMFLVAVLGLWLRTARAGGLTAALPTLYIPRKENRWYQKCVD